MKELYKIPTHKLHQEHDEEIAQIMKESKSSFRKWNGKLFWKLANECGHTSLDFNFCECKIKT